MTLMYDGAIYCELKSWLDAYQEVLQETRYWLSADIQGFETHSYATDPAQAVTR